MYQMIRSGLARSLFDAIAPPCSLKLTPLQKTEHCYGCACSAIANRSLCDSQAVAFGSRGQAVLARGVQH